MGWVSLTLRKLSLRSSIQSKELRDIQISRAVRANNRQLSSDQSVQNRQDELNDAKSVYMEVRDDKPDSDSPEYSEWMQTYNEAREDYEAQKLDINNYYDDILKELEEEATDRETNYQEEQTTLESELEAMRSEFDSVKEQISSDIEKSTIEF